MINKFGKEQIELVKVKIIDTTLLVGSILGFISYIISLFQIPQTGFRIAYITDFIVIGSFVSLSFIRKKTSLKIKYYAILIGLFTLVIIDLVNVGVYSENKTLLILIPFYSLLIFPFKKTIQIYSIGIVAFGIVGFLHINKYLTPSVDLLLRANDITLWIINLIIITIIAFIIVIITRQFIKAYTDMVSDLETKTQTIAEQEEYYRKVFDSSTDAIFIHNYEGNILDVNNTMLNLYGYTRENIKRLSVNDLSSEHPPYNEENAMAYFEMATMGIDQKFDWQAKKKSGQFLWVEVILKQINIGAYKRVLGVVRDINEKKNTELLLQEYRDNLENTVKKRTQELEKTNKTLVLTNSELNGALNKLKKTQNQLIQSEKMASLGIMASGVAHEINNPLNYIMGGSTRIEFYAHDNIPMHLEQIKPMLEDINTGVKRAANIVSSLSHFSRLTHSLDEYCDINEIIKNCLTVTRNQWEHHFNIIETLQDDLPKLIGNEGKLHQVFVNIISNAFQAMKENGELKIKTSLEAHKIHIEIKDNGIGIENENINKITDPFFTTKDPGKGTGLGMSISYNIIKEHQGDITFTSKPNIGTTVLVILPTKNIPT